MNVLGTISFSRFPGFGGFQVTPKMSGVRYPNDQVQSWNHVIYWSDYVLSTRPVTSKSNPSLWKFVFMLFKDSHLKYESGDASCSLGF